MPLTPAIFVAPQIGPCSSLLIGLDPRTPGVRKHPPSLPSDILSVRGQQSISVLRPMSLWVDTLLFALAAALALAAAAVLLRRWAQRALRVAARECDQDCGPGAKLTMRKRTTLIHRRTLEDPLHCKVVYIYIYIYSDTRSRKRF